MVLECAKWCLRTFKFHYVMSHKESYHKTPLYTKRQKAGKECGNEAKEVEGVPLLEEN